MLAEEGSWWLLVPVSWWLGAEWLSSVAELSAPKSIAQLLVEQSWWSWLCSLVWAEEL